MTSYLALCNAFFGGGQVTKAAAACRGRIWCRASVFIAVVFSVFLVFLPVKVYILQLVILAATSQLERCRVRLHLFDVRVCCDRIHLISSGPRRNRIWPDCHLGSFFRGSHETSRGDVDGGGSLWGRQRGLAEHDGQTGDLDSFVRRVQASRATCLTWKLVTAGLSTSTPCASELHSGQWDVFHHSDLHRRESLMHILTLQLSLSSHADHFDQGSAAAPCQL